MGRIGTAFLLLIFVALNAALGTRLTVGETPLPPLGRFISPQEGFWRNAEAVEQQPPREIRIKGLSAPVQVAWDESGIPHVFAANDSDLYRVQGHVMAMLRLWQLDFVARAAAGRLSEVLGPMALEFDRDKRRKGMLTGAEASTRAMRDDPEMETALHAYADGYNQHLASLRYRDLPVEYKLLAYRPEPWSPLRSALVQQYMIDNLSGSDRDAENTHALAALGGDLFELLFPARPPGMVPTVPTDSIWSFVPETMAPPPDYDPLNGYHVDAHRSDPANGSNNWAVHGSRTVNGHPLLANDTHLGLNFPPIWIPIQLSTPEHMVFGFTIPGACGVVIGHNEHAAWGVTNAPRDTRDWYRITWQDDKRVKYLHGGEWSPVEYRVERIKVRGEAEVVDTVRITLHGPVVHDSGPVTSASGHALALRWTGHEANLTQKALYLNNRVRGHADHVEAMRWFHAPAQNWVFATVDGRISMRVQGRFPNKWKEQGRFILDGADIAHLWQGWIPFEHTATQVDPARGFVSSANQHSVDESYPYWFHNDHLEYYRNRSINTALGSLRKFNVQDMMDLQQSAFDLKAVEGLQALVPLLDTLPLDSMALATLHMLRTWDCDSRYDREEPTLFNLWFDGVRDSLWAPLSQKSEHPIGVPTAYNTIRILADSTLREQVEEALDVDAREVVFMAFIRMLEKRVAEGPLLWRDHNNARVTHLALLAPFSKDMLPVHGSGTAINAQRGVHGPSQRFVVELSDPPRAWYQLPGGISGNPGSRRYDDLLTEWHSGVYREVRFLRSASEGQEMGMPLTDLVP